MSVVAVYNMKGGVGKTTTAVNLSYLSACAGKRVLLWDLDPQAASSFAFRVQPRVTGFGKRSLEGGDSLAAAIKETDYSNLDLLPSDFAYRKLDRLLDRFDKPTQTFAHLLAALCSEYDTVFLDCPPGFSLLTEGIFEVADAVLVPTIPTVLSLRMVARLIKWADRSQSPSELVAFLSMVDRRKVLHRRTSEWIAGQPDIFLAGQIPYASIVEQMAVQRMPVTVFAPRDPASEAFVNVWSELQRRLQGRGSQCSQPRDRWANPLKAIESLIAGLESAGDPDSGSSYHACAVNPAPSHGQRDIDSVTKGDVCFVHRFDTERRDLQRCGYVLELRERTGNLLVVAARSNGDHPVEAAEAAAAHVQVDRSWAREILSGSMSPLTALERRLGRPSPRPVEEIRSVVSGRKLLRIDSRSEGDGCGRP